MYLVPVDTYYTRVCMYVNIFIVLRILANFCNEIYQNYV